MDFKYSKPSFSASPTGLILAFFFPHPAAALCYRQDTRVWLHADVVVYVQRNPGQLRLKFHPQVTAPLRAFLSTGSSLEHSLEL